MNYPTPFIATLVVGSKMIAKMYNSSKLIPVLLFTALFASITIFYAGFAHLIPTTIFSIISCIPLANAIISEGLDSYGLSSYKIITRIAQSLLVAILLTHGTNLGFLKIIQAVWSLSLINSMVETFNKDVIKPLKSMRKKHEYSV